MTARAFVDKKEPKLTKWVPRKWQPEYERMVAYSAMGWSNIKIAQELKYTTVHVSNVLNLPQAKELRDKILARMRERTLEDVPNILQRIALKTAERLETVVNDDEMFLKTPFAIIDRGLDILKGTGHLKGGGNGALGIQNQQNNFFNGVPPALLEQLNAGSAAANKALEIHASPADKDKVG